MKKMDFPYIVHTQAGGENRTARGTGTCQWDPADPLFLTLHLDVEGDPTTTWVVSRDLLAEGVYSWAPVGLSDIRVRRTMFQVVMQLRVAGHSSDVIAPREVFVDFLCDTLDQIPSGEGVETEILLSSLDAFIEQVYREGDVK